MAAVKVTILGAGAIGMAMAVVLSSNDYAVCFWDIDKDVVDGINKKHLNPRSLPHIKLEKNVTAESDLTKAVFGAEIVVIALASPVVREVCLKIKDVLARNCVIVSATKGLEAGSLAVMTEVIYQALGGWRDQILAFSGPSLAGELAAKKPTAVMLASPKANAYSQRATDALSTPWLHLTGTRDVVGVQLAAVAKHGIAILFGLADGLGFGSNAKGWILMEAFRDMARLVWKNGGQEDTVYGLAGLGDALATSLSLESRNRMFGELLGKGKTTTKALSIINQTVEGAEAVDSLYKLAQKEKLNLPTLQALYEVVNLKKSANKVFTDLLQGF